MHILGVCALMALARCRSVVPTAQGTSDWAGLGRIQGLQAKPALPLKKEMTNNGTNQEETTPEAALPGHIQRPTAFVGGTQDEALGELEEMFRETEDYEDEGSDGEESLTTTAFNKSDASNNSDLLSGFCMVRVICARAGLAPILF